MSTETRERIARHALEVFLVTLIGILLSLANVFPPEVPGWLFPAVMVTGALVIVLAYTWWGADADDAGVVKRIVLQCGVLTGITYTTGWGFALPLVHLFAVADNVKYAGSRSVRITIAAAAGWTSVGQVALTLGLAPSIHEPVGDTWAIAAFMVLAVTQVSARIGEMTRDREAAEAEVATSERRFRSLVEDSSDVVLVIRDGVVTYQSPSTETVLGHHFDEVDGTPYLDYVHPDDRDLVVNQVLELLDQPDVSKSIECRLRHGAGHWIVVETRTRNLTADTNVGGYVVNLRDVTDRKNLEAQLEHRAFHDPLTDLPNRALFRDRVEHVVARAGRRDLDAAVLYLDLDGFKGVNDSQGHAAGDVVLVEVARRIDRVVRESDTAARLGGDEFAVLLEDFDGVRGAARAAERLLEVLRQPVILDDGSPAEVGASIGIAIHQPGESAEDLLRNADLAMYMAKADGKGRYEVFEPEMHLAVVERLRLERDLEQAVANDELLLHYQPIVALDDDRVVGVEALLRWEHPVRGMVSPGDFIPMAEDTGLIVPIGRWVLHEAFTQAVRWQSQQSSGQPLGVSVNVSMRQIADASFVDDVAEALAATGIPASTVTLELTESALVRDTEHVVEVLRQLRGLGVRLAIDDFGTGYSSLAYLQRFPVDVLKIDRSFVEGMVTGTQSPALVRAIVDMSRSLDLQTVIEGIEREEELSRVRTLQCNLGQGYLFARPASAEKVDRLLRSAGMVSDAPARESQGTA